MIVRELIWKAVFPKPGFGVSELRIAVLLAKSFQNGNALKRFIFHKNLIVNIL